MPRGVFPRKRYGCAVQGCENKHRSSGFCEKHYRLFHKYGVPFGPGRGRGPRPNRSKKDKS